MRPVIVRYESSFNSFLTAPFEIGLRHFKVAFSKGSHNTLIKLAKERIIYRPLARDDAYKPLTIGHRIYHITVGTLETFGYLTLIVPFIVTLAEKVFIRPWCIKGSPEFRTHINEGGSSFTEQTLWWKNPFDKDVKDDSFYNGASWLSS